MTYIPGHARIDEPTPQTHPELFTSVEIKAEIDHLVELDATDPFGPNPLRAAARVALFTELARARKAGR